MCVFARGAERDTGHGHERRDKLDMAADDGDDIDSGKNDNWAAAAAAAASDDDRAKCNN